MGVLRDTADRVVQSFTNLFKFEVDPALDERGNVEKVVAETGVVAGLISCVQPIPLADIVVLTPLHVKMTLQIGKIKGFEVTQERALDIVREVIGVAWLALASQAVIGVIGKLIPVARVVFNFTLNYAATWAIGNVVDYYFDCLREGTIPSAEVMKDLFAEEFRVGKKRGEAFDPNDMKARAEALRARVRQRDPSLATRTRLEPKERKVRAAPAAPSPTSAPTPAASASGRLKIRITKKELRGEEEAQAAPAPEPASEEGPPAKTLGPVDERPEVQIGFKRPPKTLGADGRPSLGELLPGIDLSGQAAPDAPAAEPEPEGLVDRLERLASLHQQGALSAEEFAQAKGRLLAEESL